MATKTTIEMAREAAGDDWGLFQEYMPEIHRLAELVRADERARMATDKSKEAMKLALGKIKSARDCHFAAIDTLLFEAEEILEEALAEQPAQRTWVELTPEDIESIFNNWPTYHLDHEEFARAIEATLREKNS